MSETVKIWLSNLINPELDDAVGSITNEELWILGSNSTEEQMMHESNIEELREYAKILLSIKNNYDI